MQVNNSCQLSLLSNKTIIGFNLAPIIAISIWL